MTALVFSSCSKQDSSSCSPWASHCSDSLIASAWAQHCGARAQLPRGMWNLPGTRRSNPCPCTGRHLTTGPAGSPRYDSYYFPPFCQKNLFLWSYQGPRDEIHSWMVFNSVFWDRTRVLVFLLAAYLPRLNSCPIWPIVKSFGWLAGGVFAPHHVPVLETKRKLQDELLWELTQKRPDPVLEAFNLSLSVNTAFWGTFSYFYANFYVFRHTQKPGS